MKIENFSDVLEYLDGIPNINCGGCGVSALAMYLWLKKHNQLKDTKFLFFYYDRDSYEENAQGGNRWAPAHCILLHNGQFIDSEGVLDNHHLGNYFQILNEDEVRESLNTSVDWCDAFDRSTNVPKIEKKLGIKLDIELEVEHRCLDDYDEERLF